MNGKQAKKLRKLAEKEKPGDRSFYQKLKEAYKSLKGSRH